MSRDADPVAPVGTGKCDGSQTCQCHSLCRYRTLAPPGYARCHDLFAGRPEFTECVHAGTCGGAAACCVMVLVTRRQARSCFPAAVRPLARALAIPPMPLTDTHSDTRRHCWPLHDAPCLRRYRARARAFCESLRPHHDQWERDGRVPRHVFAEAAKQGLYCMVRVSMHAFHRLLRRVPCIVEPRASATLGTTATQIASGL